MEPVWLYSPKKCLRRPMSTEMEKKTTRTHSQLTHFICGKQTALGLHKKF